MLVTKKRSSATNMIEGLILKQLLIFAGPMIIIGILQRFYNMADALAAGQYLGDTAVAALGVTSSLTDLILKLFIGLSVGTGAVLAYCFGANDMKRIHDTIHTAVAFALFSGIIIGILGALLSRSLLTLIDTPAELMKLSTVYLRTCFLGTPALMLFNFLSAIMRATGDTKTPLFYLGISGVLNVLFNWVFTEVIELGVFGLGMATVIAQCVAAGCMFVKLVNTEGNCKLEIRAIRMHSKAFRDILNLGLPAGIQSIAFSLSNVLVQKAMNSFGTMAIAGNTAAANLGDFMDIATSGIYHTALIFVSQNYGANRWDRIRQGVRQCVLLCVGCSALLGTSCLIFHKPLLGLYAQEQEALKVGLLRLQIMCIPHIFCGIMDAVSGSLRGLKCSVIPMCTSILCVCVVRIIWLYTAFRMWPTLETMYLSYPITWFMGAAANVVCYKIVTRGRFNKAWLK